MPLPDPVIVVHAITASYLADSYPLPPEVIWSVLTKDYERAKLHPDDLRYEAREPARIEPGQIYEIVYRELIEELRYNLANSPDETIPVYPFSYDWRHPLEATQARLDAFIREVIGRTGLMRHYHRDGYADRARVNLVGHSMGGLVIAGYLADLAQRDESAPVNKIATLAAPFQGSFEAVIKVTTGTANLGTSAPSSREREAARVTPALYYLLPSFAEGVDIDAPFPKDLFDPEVWQPSILATVTDYVRMHGRDPGDAGAQAARLFARLLDAARSHRRKLLELDLSNLDMDPGRWLCVVGVDAETRVGLKVANRAGAPEFEFDSKDRANDWKLGGRRTGDGTVPLAGAIPPFLPHDSAVCVTPEDFGYWELQDRAIAKLDGFHGIIPGMDMLHRLIVRHFTGRPDPHGKTWGRRPPGVETWRPPIPDLREKRD